MSADLDKIRNCLLTEPLDGDFVQEDGGEGLPLTPAAVLFPIVLRDGGETVLLIGFLPVYRTGTGFRVTPVVALVRPPFQLDPDEFEVAEVFEVPLAFLLDPENHKRHSLHYRGALRHFFAMPYGDYFIWGATAGMIRSLTERLGTLSI